MSNLDKRLPYHFRYHDDALRGYRELSLEERGAYTTLLDLMYSDDWFIKDNERILAAEMGVSTRKYRSLRDSLIRKGKIYYVEPGLLSNRRFEEEARRRDERRVSAQIRGKFGGRNKAENDKKRKEFNDGFYLDSSSPYSRTKNNKNSASITGSSCGNDGDENDHENLELHPSVKAFIERQKKAGRY